VLPEWVAGIKAKIGYKCRLGMFGGRPSVVVGSTLDRQLDVTVPDTAWATDIIYVQTCEGSLISQSSMTSIPAGYRLGDAELSNHRRRPAHGFVDGKAKVPGRSTRAKARNSRA